MSKTLADEDGDTIWNEPIDPQAETAVSDTTEQLWSSCCLSSMRVEGGAEGTNHYVCNACNESCNWVDKQASDTTEQPNELRAELANIILKDDNASIDKVRLDELIALFTKQLERLLEQRQSIPVHGGTDSYYPSKHIQAIEVSAVEALIKELRGGV